MDGTSGGNSLKKKTDTLRKRGVTLSLILRPPWGFSEMNEDLAAAASSYVDGQPLKFSSRRKESTNLLKPLSLGLYN